MQRKLVVVDALIWRRLHFSACTCSDSVRTPNAWRWLEGHTQPLTSINWSHSGRHVLTASDDGTVRLWTPSEPSALLTVPPANGPQAPQRAGRTNADKAGRLKGVGDGASVRGCSTSRGANTASSRVQLQLRSTPAQPGGQQVSDSQNCNKACRISDSELLCRWIRSQGNLVSWQSKG